MRRWLMAAVASIGALVLAEGTLRILDLPSRSAEFQFVQPDLEVGEVFADFGGALVDDPELFWTLDPALGNRLSNSHGLRGWWPSRTKSPRDLRVVCVGDSCTYGMSVRYENTYGVQLEALLQARLPEHCVETVLLALPGYSTQQDRILCERHLAALRPDVTVLYCGAWNDYLPAVALSDAERYRRNTSRAPRLLQLLAGFSGRSDVDENELKRAFRDGQAPNGRRVPLDEFRQNLEQMIAMARRDGSRVVVIVPPLPAATAERYPISLEYRTALRAVAVAHEVPLVDGPALFDAAPSAPPLFHDWVHPTARGHRLLAAALLERLEADLPASAPAATGPTVQIESVAPKRIAALSTPLVEIEGRGFANPGAFDRLWVGPQWIDEFEVEGDDRLRFTIRQPLPPGRHAVELRTARGVVRGPELLVVDHEPLPLTARVDAAPGGAPSALRLRLSGPGPADCLVGAWLATGLLPEPFDSGYGPFWLRTDSSDPTPGALRLDRLGLFSTHGQTRPGGGWELEIDLAQAGITLDGDVIFAQALLADRYDPNFARFTTAVRIELPQ